MHFTFYLIIRNLLLYLQTIFFNKRRIIFMLQDHRLDSLLEIIEYRFDIIRNSLSLPSPRCEA